MSEHRPGARPTTWRTRPTDGGWNARCRTLLVARIDPVPAIWIAIAFWPARVAGRKGHSFIGYFIFSLIFFPAALIVAYMVSDRRTAAIA